MATSGSFVTDEPHEGRKLKEGFERHVFITHCEADNEFAKNLYRKLQAKGFQCGMASQDFMGGVQIFDQIITFIETSEKILSLISRQSLKSYWCTLELSLTLERSIDNDRLAIVPVLLDVETKELPDVLRQLECIDGKVDGFLDDVMNMIIGPDVSVESLLPVGNVGHGFAWSYYYSFLKILLPILNERIQKCPHWQSDPKRRCIPRRMYLLLPESCICPGKLTDWDKRIVADTPLEPVIRWRAGKERTYKNSVYKIQDDKTFYFLGEFCSVVQPMNDMEVGGIARMSADEKKRQLYRFKCTLEDILGYYHSNKYRLILFNDTDGKCKAYPFCIMTLMVSVKRTHSV
ncbi:stimulator of interferon genes protein-like isoform X2 [Liolophura sinensis]|uniref:stimulator of interferon genes protein-like isoform X2 n=1 Tax=Liolophura sinensis TaxID=3198878 RepID=UPI00315889E0